MHEQSNVIPIERGSRGASHYPKRPPNSELRAREYLLESEVEALIKAVRQRGRNGPRNAAMVLLAYRHGLRVSELIQLRWEQLDLKQGTIHVRRRKSGQASSHPLTGRELRVLRQHKLTASNNGGLYDRYVFLSERGAPMTCHGFRKILSRAMEAADLEIKVHPHMLRHGTGYYLAAKGEDTRAIQHYLGHTNIKHTATYTALAPGRFNNFWED